MLKIRKSIMQTEKECYITGAVSGLERHHIFEGPNRKVSDRNGFWVWLIGYYHNKSDYGVHMKNGHELDMRLKRECQAKYEQAHTREQFMALIGKNYLE